MARRRGAREIRDAPFSAPTLRLAREAGLAGITAWRVNDVVAYDAMRESATTLTAMLLGATHSSSANPDTVQAEIAQLRQGVLAVDAFDRAAVAALSARISGRILEQSGAPT